MSGNAPCDVTNQSPVDSISKIPDVADGLLLRNAIRRRVQIVFYDTERKMADRSRPFWDRRACKLLGLALGKAQRESGATDQLLLLPANLCGALGPVEHILVQVEIDQSLVRNARARLPQTKDNWR